METNPAVSIPNPEAEAKPKSRKKAVIVGAALALTGLILTAIFVSALLTNPTAPEQNNNWIFKGAYAEYEGSTSVMGFSFDFSARLEIKDFNSTHAYILTSFNMGSSLGETMNEEKSQWVELTSTSFLEAFNQEADVTNSYQKTISFPGLGTRSCTVYEIATEGPTIIVYVDNQVRWPLKMQISMSGEDLPSLSMDIKLVTTNIPALK